MKTTLYILTFAIVVSVLPVKPTTYKTENYQTQMAQLDIVEKELKTIEKEVDNQIVNKALTYKKEITELQKMNNSLKSKVVIRVDTIYIVDTLRTKKDTIR